MALGKRLVFLSLAWREARAASRKRRFYLIRLAVAAACLLAFPIRMDTGPGATGTRVFEAMAWLAFIYCLFGGVLRTCDTLAEEKREGTLGLLLLTDLNPSSVILGKMLSATAATLFGLLAILPILALPILIGGVTKDQLLRVSLNLLNTLFLSIAWGFLISACARKHVVTMLLGFLVPVFFAGGVSLLAIRMFDAYDSGEISLALALPSPGIANAAALVDNPEAIKFFWDSLAVNHILAWGCLLLATQIFPRRAHDTPANPVAERRIERFRIMRYGTANVRAALRRRLLELNPLIWFVNRDRIDSIVLVGICGLILFIGLLLNSSEWAVLLAIFILLFRMSHESSHSVSEDQKNGALELLLSTRLSVAEIIEGRVDAIRRRFLPAVALIIVWTFATAFLRHESRPKVAVALAVWLIACWFALAWIGPWFALRARKPVTATWMTLLAVTLPPFSACIFVALPSIFDGRLDDAIPVAIASCAWVGVGHCLLLIRWARQMLFKNFRAAAADRFATRKFEGVFTSDATFKYFYSRDITSPRSSTAR